MRIFYFILIGMFFSTYCEVVFASYHLFGPHTKIRHHAKASHWAMKSPKHVPLKKPILINGASQLITELNRIITNNNLKGDITVYIKSMRNGATLYTLNVNRPFVPASTLKILTAEAALLFLGPNYRFSTQLLTDAKTIKNGVLQGNIFIRLSGDPSLTYYHLVDLLAALKSQQINAISGSVYIDNTAYDQRFYGPGWEEEDKKNCYGAPISASIINHNCMAFKATPAKVTGRVAQILASQTYFHPSAKQNKSKRPHTCSISLSTIPNSFISVDGCLGNGRYAWGLNYVVTDVPEYDRTLFKGLFNKLGIKVYGMITFGAAHNKLPFVSMHASPPLRLLITEMLKKSDNVIAGALFKKIGQMYTGKPGSWENGSIAVSRILAKQTGLNPSGMRLLDGSGLSPDNLLTAAQMMTVLYFAYHHKTGEDFISSLPIAGVDGTLKHRLISITRKVRAKTGTISGVVSLAGYTMSRNSEPLAFVIMINGKGMHWNYKTLEDQIVLALTRYIGQ